MKTIATWNINGVRARLPYLLLWLAEVQPDLVGLQELKSTDEEFPRAELEALGYYVATHGQKGWNGVAVLSKAPIVVRQAGLPGQEELGARYLEVESDKLLFTTIYCPNGKTLLHEDFKRKLAWFDALARTLRERQDVAGDLVVCGDFNVVPGALDSWNEVLFADSIFHTPEERARYTALLDWGLVDTYRALEPDGVCFTWWDYRGGAFHKKRGLRIDALLTSPTLAARAKSVEVERKWRKNAGEHKPSDHAPVVLTLD